MEKIRIAVVDDNREFCRLVSHYSKMVDDIEVVGVAHNGFDGLDLIEKKQPDAVILGSIMPELDGIGVLKRITKLNIDKVPDIVFITDYATEHLLQGAIACGISYIVYRRSDIAEIVDRCRMAVETTKKMELSKEPARVAEELTTSYIQTIGIPANVKGYHFLREAILIVADNPMRGSGITKDLYPEVAKKFNTTASKVERNIRNAIEIAFKRGNDETYVKIFKGTINPAKGRPTNSEFISMISDRVSYELKNMAW